MAIITAMAMHEWECIWAFPWGWPYYYQPPVVIRQEPQVYIERSAPQASPAAEAYWHYCNSPQGYYPYVKECPGGWMRVTPTPPN